MDDYILPKAVANWLKDNKIKIFGVGGVGGGASQITNLNPIENLWAELKKHVPARRLTNLTLFHCFVQSYGPNFQQFILKCLWKATKTFFYPI